VSNRIAVIGIGNTLRRDDGIGVMILESLLKFYKQEGIDYLNFGIASFDLLNRMQDYDAALLIDGIEASLSVGELKIFKLEDITHNQDIHRVSTHELNLRDIFELSRRFQLKTRIYVAGIQVKDTSPGGSLSWPLNKRLDRFVREINLFIHEVLLSKQ
jgi:hydrogenase maturation protease